MESNDKETSANAAKVVCKWGVKIPAPAAADDRRYASAAIS